MPVAGDRRCGHWRQDTHGSWPRFRNCSRPLGDHPIFLFRSASLLFYSPLAASHSRLLSPTLCSSSEIASSFPHLRQYRYPEPTQLCFLTRQTMYLNIHMTLPLCPADAIMASEHENQMRIALRKVHASDPESIRKAQANARHLSPRVPLSASPCL